MLGRSITYRNDPENLCIDIKNSNVNLTDQFENVNKAWGHLYTTLLDIFNKHTPIIKKNVKGNSGLWLTSELKKKMNERDKRLRRCRNTTRKIDISSCKIKRNEVNIALCKARPAYFKTFLN